MMAGQTSLDFNHYEITIDDRENTVSVRENWRYIWETRFLSSNWQESANFLTMGLDSAWKREMAYPDYVPAIHLLTGLIPWSLAERDIFHKECNSNIQTYLSGKIRLSVSGTSEFAIRNSRKKFTVIFCINPVTSGEHWTIHARKLGGSYQKYSRVAHHYERAVLYQYGAGSIESRETIVSSGKRIESRQVSVVHEFLHTLTDKIDDYDQGKFPHIKGSAFLDDTESVRHSGMELRNRHFEELLVSINKIIPNTSFKIEDISTVSIKE